jgi:hypothetical protein
MKKQRSLNQIALITALLTDCWSIGKILTSLGYTGHPFICENMPGFRNLGTSSMTLFRTLKYIRLKTI